MVEGETSQFGYWEGFPAFLTTTTCILLLLLDFL
jgi:hypothetical protein